MKNILFTTTFSIIVAAILLAPSFTQQAFAGKVCTTGPTTLDVLLSGNCIIAGDKIFENWELFGALGIYDLANVDVFPVNDDPNNPGLRYVTNNLSVAQAGFINWIIEYDVSTLSGDPLIKDYSLEMTEFSPDSLNTSPAIAEDTVPSGPSRIVVSPSQPEADAFFNPTNTLRVQLEVVVVGSFGPNSLQEFVALYSQVPPTPTSQVAGELLPIDSSAGAIFQVIITLLRWIREEGDKNLSSGAVVSGFAAGMLVMYLTSILV